MLVAFVARRGRHNLALAAWLVLLLRGFCVKCPQPLKMNNNHLTGALAVLVFNSFILSEFPSSSPCTQSPNPNVPAWNLRTPVDDSNEVDASGELETSNEVDATNEVDASNEVNASNKLQTSNEVNELQTSHHMQQQIIRANISPSSLP